ncbi:ABC transporter permease [Paenibacillus humicola]|uniref:ABC transporter permease n=1 Tax=Paenibacillus humicola TaxID=3110540 RepID=UPI00237AA7B9|nr:ABC transporter permease [Paenibacillus humicola]
MNILSIARKEIKRDFRDIRTLIFMLVFPIVLMLILGTALTNAFSSSIQLGGMTLLYRVDAGSGAAAAWQTFMKGAAGSGVEFVKAEPGTDGKSKVEDNTYTGYADVTDKGVRYYGSSRSTLESSVIQGMLNVFADKYNLAAGVAESAPSKVGAVLAASARGDIVQEQSLNADRAPGALDYYAMSMTTMIVLYGAISANSLMRGEIARRTSMRLLASPVSRAEVFIGKIAGSIVLNLLCVVAVVVFSLLVYKANWGSHYGAVLLVLLTEIMFAVSLGLAISYFMKGEASRGVLMILTQIFSFIGGAYFPVGSGNGLWSYLPYLSPLHWENTALTQIIYADSVRGAIPAIGLNAGLAALLIAIAAFAMKRREGL